MSCIEDSRDNCIKTSDIFLNHEYKADTNNNVLDQYLKHSMLFIYNEAGKLVREVDLTKDELTFGSKVGVLEGGYYTFIAWANIDKNSVIESHESIQNGRIKTLNTTSGKNIYSTSDKLYFARKEVFIPYNDSNEPKQFTELLTYQSAHINFKVIARGQIKEDINLVFKNLMPEYGYSMNSLGSLEASYHPHVTKKPIQGDEFEYTAEFSVFRFKDDNKITVDVFKESTGEPIGTTIELKKLMQKHQISVDNKQEVNILIEIELDQKAYLTVTIKDWDEDDIIPQN